MKLLDLLFPKKCIGCGKFGGYVCDECQVGIWEEDQICPVCTRNSRYGLRHKYCQKPYYLDGVSCFWAYEALARKLIIKAKFNYYFDYLSELIVNSSELLVRPEYTELAWFISQNPTTVPIPLHPKRLRERGFNQAEIIARHLSKIFGLPMAPMLQRTKNTDHQVGKSRSERLKNLEDAFQLNYIKHKLPTHVLLVDDVWTTGSTMSECAKTLKKGGVKKVWGLVLAR
jgi:competence protein ComFC